MTGDGDEELGVVTLSSKDGSRRMDVSIRRVSPDGHLVQPTIDLMVKHFIPRETMNSLLGLPSEPNSCKNLEMLWREKLQAGNCLAAVIVNGGSETKVVGANITYVVDKYEEDFDTELGGPALKTIGLVLKHISESCDICAKHKVVRYLSAMGLGVDDQFNGMGLGLELLKARTELCRRLGLTCSSTVFTSPISQHLASKAGFETDYSIRYNDVTVDGNRVFSQAPADIHLKLMSRTYQF